MGFDLSSIASTIMGGDALKGIASSTGLSSKDVSSILTNALPQLLNGASKQTTNAKTASSFASALQQHASNNTTNLSSFFKNVDLTDGGKIVGHLLGSKNDATTNKISKDLGIDSKDVTKVLAAAAPLLMSLLGKKAQSAKKENESSLESIAGSLLKNVDVGDILKGFLK